MPFVSDADVKGLHERLGDEWSTIAVAIKNASDKLSQEELSSYSVLASRVSTFLGDSPSLLRAASQMNTGEALERDVFSFVERIRASGVPGLPSAPAEPAKTSLDKLVDALPLVLLALVALEALPRLAPAKR